MSASPGQSSAPAGRSRTALCAGTLLMLGSLTPWASFLGLAQASGLQVGFGWVTLLAGALAVTLALAPAWLRRRPGLWAQRARVLLGAGVISALDCLLVILGASHSQYGPAIGPQWGVFLTLLAAIALCLLARGEQR